MKSLSLEEKALWIYLVSCLLTYSGYSIFLFWQSANMPLIETGYEQAMIMSIGAVIFINILGRILLAVMYSRDAYNKDIRDKEINRFGEYVGCSLLAFTVLIPFGMVLYEVDHFWIAHTMYAAFALSTLTATTVKLVAYQRGF